MLSSIFACKYLTEVLFREMYRVINFCGLRWKLYIGNVVGDRSTIKIVTHLRHGRYNFTDQKERAYKSTNRQRDIIPRFYSAQFSTETHGHAFNILLALKICLDHLKPILSVVMWIVPLFSTWQSWSARYNDNYRNNGYFSDSRNDRNYSRDDSIACYVMKSKFHQTAVTSWESEWLKAMRKHSYFVIISNRRFIRWNQRKMSFLTL